MSHSSKEHRDTEFVGLGDRVRIADAAAWLHDGGNAILRSQGHAPTFRLPESTTPI